MQRLRALKSEIDSIKDKHRDEYFGQYLPAERTKLFALIRRLQDLPAAARGWVRGSLVMPLGASTARHWPRRNGHVAIFDRQRKYGPL